MMSLPNASSTDQRVNALAIRSLDVGWSSTARQARTATVSVVVSSQFHLTANRINCSLLLRSLCFLSRTRIVVKRALLFVAIEPAVIMLFCYIKRSDSLPKSPTSMCVMCVSSSNESKSRSKSQFLQVVF